jgi:RHS repeat-associated protein
VVGSQSGCAAYATSSVTGVSLNLGSNSVSASICDNAGNCGSGSWTVRRVTPAAPTITLKNLNSDNQDRSLCLTVGAGQAAGLSCGDLFVVHGMPAYRTMGRDRSLSLFYSSATAAPRPTVAVWVTEASSTQTPSTVFAKLTVDSTVVGVVDSASYTAWSSATNGTRQLVLGFDASGLASGIHHFKVEVQNRYPSPLADTASGELLVVNRSASEFGAGWWLEGVEQLVTGQSNNRLFWIGGDGSAAVYNQVNTTTWARASGAFLDTIVLASGHYTRHLRHGIQVVFDGSGHDSVTISKAHPGQVTTFTWSGSPQRLTAIQVPPSAINASYALVWNSSTHLLDSIVDPPGRSIRATMSSGTLTQVRNPDLRTTGFSYDGSRRLTGRTTPRGYATTFAYANGLHVTRVAIPLNPAVSDSARDSSRTTMEWWDEKGLAIGSPAGTQSGVDTTNSCTRIYGPRINVADNATFWVDRWGAPLKVVGPVYDTTVLARSTTTGLVSMVRNPVGDSVTATYNSRGNDSTVTDQTHEGGGADTAVTTSYVYGDAQVPDEPTLIRAPVDTTTIQYNDSLGVPSQITRQGGARIGFAFDLTKGLLTSVTEYGARVVDTTTWSRSRANLTTTFLYNAAGNDSIVTSPSGRRVTHWRDAYQRAVYSVDNNLHRVDRAFDIMNRDTATVVWDGIGAATDTVHIRYDADGMTDTILDPRQVRQVWMFDAAGRDTSVQDEAGASERRFYGPSGLLDSVQMRTTKMIRHRYDDGGRLIATVYPAFENHFTYFQGSGAADSTLGGDSIINTWDPNGRLLTTKRSNAEIVRAYNREGTVRTDSQLVRSSSGGSVVFHLTTRYWTDAGDRRARFFNGVDTITYRYGHNALDSLLIVKWTTSGVAPDTFEFLWDSMGRRDSVIYHAPRASIFYGYDVDGRLRYLCSVHPGDPNGYSDDYLSHRFRVISLDPDGLQTSWDEQAGGDQSHGSSCSSLQNTLQGVTGITYDAKHQMRRDGATLSYFYDASGNRSARRWSSDGSFRDSLAFDAHSNRVHVLFQPNASGVPTAWDTLSYDSNGALHEQRPSGGPLNGNWHLYYYNALGEMTGNRAFVADSGYWVGAAGNCRYDPTGRRVSPCGAGGWLGYDGDNAVIYSLFSTTTPTWRFAHGPGLDDPLVGLYLLPPSQFSKYYFITDGQGRQLAFTDASGTTKQTDPVFYQNGGSQAGAITSSQTFEGGRSSSTQAPQLSYYRNRYYDQETGRWTQEDPMGVGGGLNLYGYVGNNPASFTDPFGLEPDTVTGQTAEYEEGKANMAACMVSGALGTGLCTAALGEAAAAGLTLLQAAEASSRVYNISIDPGLMNWGFHTTTPTGMDIKLNPNYMSDEFWLPAAVVHEVSEAYEMDHGATYREAHPRAVADAEDPALAGRGFETRTSRSAGCDVFPLPAPRTLFGARPAPLCNR